MTSMCTTRTTALNRSHQSVSNLLMPAHAQHAAGILSQIVAIHVKQHVELQEIRKNQPLSSVPYLVVKVQNPHLTALVSFSG